MEKTFSKIDRTNLSHFCTGHHPGVRSYQKRVGINDGTNHHQRNNNNVNNNNNNNNVNNNNNNNNDVNNNSNEHVTSIRKEATPPQTHSSNISPFKSESNIFYIAPRFLFLLAHLIS
ncbi:hypothetical protein HELRODRAFT_183553 [Helobdella robusta]|uniref:Uncharacterized protein n=1 Tax=Helobdella robusta TaxID=6412 RepID=T1FJU1_HELRO|nr:hypothetical protein HELRODRAFT_183553 [Helobdella robusta]ESO10521.1 hypothetical protein HELRODRAFT_183553 [Helobdella robusta]